MRLGWQVVPGACTQIPVNSEGDPVMEQSEIPVRLMSFLLHMVEARFWSYAWQQWSLPEGFAAYLPTENGSKRDFQTLRTLWEAATLAERVVNSGHPSASGVSQLRREVHWLSWPLTQGVLRLLAHHGWTPAPAIDRLLLRLWLRIGDTKCVE